VPTAIRFHGGIVADPVMVTPTPSGLQYKNSDLTAICAFVAIGLVVATLLAQFG
jgi:hypothetical protein